MFRLMKCVLVLAAVVWASRAMAEDAYYYMPLDKLELTEGSLPKGEKDFGLALLGALGISASLCGFGRRWRSLCTDDASLRHIAPWEARETGTPTAYHRYGPGGKGCYRPPVCSKADITKYSPWSVDQLNGFEIVKFKIPASAADKDAKNKFLQSKTRLLSAAFKPEHSRRGVVQASSSRCTKGNGQKTVGCSSRVTTDRCGALESF